MHQNKLFVLLFAFLVFQTSFVLSASKVITSYSDVYVSFREELVGQSNSKYAIIDSNGNTQINNLFTARAPLIVNPAEMIRDSNGEVHFSYYVIDFLLNWGGNRVYYKKESSSTTEVVPLLYGTGFSFSFNGYLPWRQEMAIDSNDVPYVISGGTVYVQGQMNGSQIVVVRRFPSGWSQPVILQQSSTLSPVPEVNLVFDGSSNGHVFYELFTNSSCIGITCPRSVYELVFDQSLNVISNTQIITMSGPLPDIHTFRPLSKVSNSRYNYLATLRTSNQAQNPFSYNVGISSSKNGWVPQTLATSLVTPGQTYATSFDLDVDSSSAMHLITSEKNVISNTAKITQFTSRNQGRSWASNNLLTSTTSQYRDVFIKPKNGEMNIAYSEANFGPQMPFSKLNLINIKASGAKTNLLIYQNPIGANIMAGDVV